jgi:hypothetical protein
MSMIIGALILSAGIGVLMLMLSSLLQLSKYSRWLGGVTGLWTTSKGFFVMLAVTSIIILLMFSGTALIVSTYFGVDGFLGIP